MTCLNPTGRKWDDRDVNRSEPTDSTYSVPAPYCVTVSLTISLPGRFPTLLIRNSTQRGRRQTVSLVHKPVLFPFLS